MQAKAQHQGARLASFALAAALTTACGDDGSKDRDAPDSGAPVEAAYALASVVISPDGSRTTYVQTIKSLDDGPFNNARALEVPGHGVILGGNGSVYVGLAEEPTWIRYTPDASGALHEAGRLTLLDFGASYIDYGNVLVDADTAVSVLSQQAIAVIWNPTTMNVIGEVDLGHLVQDGYDLEVWTTTTHEGLVYIPGRWADWDGARVKNTVSLTILDPKQMKVIGVAEDDRCASGGQVVFDKDGYGYVMGDGRNYSSHMFANAAGTSAPDNCLLRIAPGETDFEADYFYTIPSLTGGLQSITELETARQGSGIGFSRMFYPDKLPEGVEPVDFSFWDEPAHKLWRIELADPPSAKEVGGLPFSSIGFSNSAFNGRLYVGETQNAGQTTEVFEVDPETNQATPTFVMDGYFWGLFDLSK